MRTLTALLQRVLAPVLQAIAEVVTERLDRHGAAAEQALTDIRAVVRLHGRRLNLLETRMTSTENAWDRAATIIGLVRAEVASLRDQLTAEQADDQAQVDTAVADARRADADRLAALVDNLAEVLPAAVPAVPVPGPGEPATDPATGETSDDVLSGTAGQTDLGTASGPAES